MSFGPCIDLFCGAGGLSLGFVQAGFAIGLGVDTDTAALQTFRYNHPSVHTLQEDVVRLSGDRLRAEFGENPVLALSAARPVKDFQWRKDTIQTIRATSCPMNTPGCSRKSSPVFF